MAHARAKLIVLKGSCLSTGWRLTAGSRPMPPKPWGVSRQTAYKWLRRFRDEGPAGLEGCTSAPLGCPHRLRANVVAPSRQPDSRRPMGPAAWPMPWGELARPSTGCSDVSMSPDSASSTVPPTVVRYERETPRRAPPWRC